MSGIDNIMVLQLDTWFIGRVILKLKVEYLLIYPQLFPNAKSPEFLFFFENTFFWVFAIIEKVFCMFLDLSYYPKYSIETAKQILI
jgi:hypothetical protein